MHHLVSLLSGLVGAFLFVYVIPFAAFEPMTSLIVTQTGDTPTFGATITTINGSDTISSSRSTINTNFSNLNTSKAEISDVSGTTTLASLTTIGTITTGVWNATKIGVPYGGTGWSNIASGTLMYGLGTSALATTTAGTDGQFLQLVGQTPTWATASVDQAGTYTWTALHTFARASSTRFSVFDTLWVGGTATSSISGTSVSVFAAGASTTALTISGSCTGCPMAYTSSSTALNLSGNTTFTGSIPSLANTALFSFTITEAGTATSKRHGFITRTGMTSLYIDNVGPSIEPNPCGYDFAWSGSDLVITETDVDGDCSITGTVYWYR